MPKNYEMTEDAQTDGQLPLPLDIRPERTVYWLHASLSERRDWLLRKKSRVDLVFDPETGQPHSTEIPADDIDKVSDLALRCALRLADATDAVGWTDHGHGLYSAHSVRIQATDEGFDSRLLSAVFTGRTDDGQDTFMENLYSARPETD